MQLMDATTAFAAAAKMMCDCGGEDYSACDCRRPLRTARGEALFWAGLRRCAAGRGSVP
jgi:hypothetical protein